jgi:hypothetical protein
MARAGRGTERTRWQAYGAIAVAHAELGDAKAAWSTERKVPRRVAGHPWRSVLRALIRSGRYDALPDAVAFAATRGSEGGYGEAEVAVDELDALARGRGAPTAAPVF